MTSERNIEFTAASTAKRLVEVETQLRFYKDREEHFARVLSVSDGGQYRADWDSRIKAIIAERDQALAEAKRLEHELREVVRAFEKFGEAGALVDANGKITPYLGVLRTLERLHWAEDNVVLLSLGLTKVTRHIAEKLPYVCATLSPGNRTALTNGMCSIDASGAERSRVFVEHILALVKAVASEVMKGSEKNET